MLSIAGARSSDYYTRLAKVGYYTDAPESPGRWYGDGAARLNLEGEISDHQGFKRVFQGFTPEGEKLVQNAGGDTRRNAVDLTFSSPKSFSAFWAIGDEKERATLESIERRAVEKALYEAKEHVITRTGKGGINREKCDLVFALFPHSTSRAEEPQRHTHCLLMNVGVRENGKTSALETPDLYRMKMTLGALYRSELSRLLKEELGISSERTKNSLEILGRPEALCDFWSTRSKEIDEHMKEHGLTTAKEAAFSCTATRSKKDMDTPLEEHIERWKGEAQNLGVTYKSALLEMRRQALLQKVKAPLHKEKEVVLQTLTAQVTQRLFKEQSHFTQFKLYQTVAEEAQSLGLTFEEIKGVKSDIEKSLITLYQSKNGLTHYTTKDTLFLEKKFIEQVETLSKNTSHVVTPNIKGRLLKEHLSDEQKLAFLHVTDTGQLKIVEGLAGTGKTTFLREANRAWLLEGYETLGVSLAAVAAENLQKEADIQNSSSLAKLFYDYEKGAININQKTVIVLDEAGMVGTYDLKKLTDICLSTGAKTVWVGDRNQLQSIAPGGAFAGASDRIGSAELNEIWRQRGTHEWGKEMVYNAAKGSITKSLSQLHEKGKIEFLDNRSESREALIRQWAIGKESLKETLILTSTREEARKVNALAQEVLFHEGKLDLSKPSFKTESQRIFVGDRVIFEENNKSLNVKNGNRGEVTEVTKTGLAIVELDEGGRRFINPNEYKKVSLSYATTVHKAQGQTKNQVFVLVDEQMIDREVFYVSVSRQRDNIKLFVNAEKSENKHEAYEDLLLSVSRSNREVLAIDLKKTLQEEERRREKIEVINSASYVASRYKEQELDPIRARVRQVGSELSRIGWERIPPDKWEEVIKERLTDHQYKKTNEAISWARHHAEKNVASFQNIIAKGEEKGWFYRNFSSEHKEALKRAKAKTKESLEELEILEKKKEKFDQYFQSPEGQERAQYFKDTFASLQKRYEQLSREYKSYNFGEKQDIYRKLNALGEEKVKVTLNVNSNTIEPHKNDVEKKYEELQKRQKQEKGHRHGYGYSY